MSTGAPPRLPRDPFPRALVVLGVLFVLLVALGLHGFSLPYWHWLVEGPETPEVLLGQPRQFRWDDYAVQLPLALAQAAHEPPFPVVNQNIGLGQNMLVPTPLPVAHAATLFRPTLWGFFLGGDVGLAWMWWAQILGLLVVWMAVFHRLLRVPLGLAAGGCGLILGSPFFQFWSFNMAPVTAYAGLCVLGLSGILWAHQARAILASALLLGWAGGCFVLTLYPPYLVSLAFLVLVVIVGAALEQQRLGPRDRRGWRGAGLVVALGIAASAVLVLHAGASEAITTLRATEYPGKRVAEGGDRPLWWLMNAALGVPLQASEEGWGTLGNACEGASCWLASPWVAAVLSWRWLREGRRPSPLVLLLLAYCVLGLLYCHFGVGAVLARATMLAHVPGKRALLGLTVAEALLVVVFASSAGTSSRHARVGHVVLAAAWALALGAAGWRLREEMPELHFGWLAAAAGLNGLAVYALAERWRPRVVVGAVAAALAASSAWFNPLVRGGAEYLRTNPIATRVRAIDHAAGGETVWAAYGLSALGTMLVANGVRAINGEQPIPQLELWRRLDPEREHLREYNRYASVHLNWPPPRGQPPGIHLTDDSNFTLYLPPDGSLLRKLGATHLVVTAPGGTGLAKFFQPFEPLARIGHHALYALPLRGAEAGAR